MITTKNVPNNTVTRDLSDFAAPTGNIYETVSIISKRANQLSVAEKKELSKKLEEFKDARETSMEEEFENHEQIEISKYYEALPKTTLVAIAEFQNGELEYRMAEEEA
ncbi:MAG: DNA-directed RNA polymerase subunit omega [Bacteroidales bacterium]|nr:DNA-directed RNA polymerase subunit omega [Bacteroidales bacterium]